MVVKLTKFEGRLLGKKWTAETLDNKFVIVHERYIEEGPFEVPSAAIKHLK
jgi:hypothetical protein